jgi:Kef-type K+ transport system membrane component KefB
VSLFYEIGLLVIGLAVLALFFKLLKQPILPVYLLSGFLLGPVLHIVPASQEPLLDSLALIGIAFLLFMAGLELDVSILLKNYKISLLGILFAVINTLVFVFVFTHLSYFNSFGSERNILAIVFSFSSTLLVVKALGEQGKVNTTLGYMALSALLVQDLIAIVALAVTQNNSFSLSVPLQGVALLVLMALIGGKFIFPYIFKFVAFSEEMLFLLSLAVLFAFSLISQSFGLSLAAGAFLGGLSLSPLLYRYEISSRMGSLRDFFVIILFLSLGLQISISSFHSLLVPFIALMILTIFLKPLIYSALGLLFRLSRPLALSDGLVKNQTSEFSLTVAHTLSPAAFSLAGYTFLASSFISSYVFEYLDKLVYFLAKILDKILPLSLFRRHFRDEEFSTLKDHVVIFGGHRMGGRLIKTLMHQGKKVLLVDNNPDIISKFSKQILTLYGDAMEPEIKDRASLATAAIIISTIPDVHVNQTLLREVNQINPKAFVYVTASDYEEALRLYDSGADFVIVPYFLGAEQANILIENFDEAVERLTKTKQDHIAKLAAELKSK